MLVKVIFDAATFWLGNTLVYDINPKLQEKPNLDNLAIWTLGNIAIRYHVLDFLKDKGVITTNDEIYVTLALMSTVINVLIDRGNLKTNIKISAVGMLSNILMTRLIYKND